MQRFAMHNRCALENATRRQYKQLHRLFTNEGNSTDKSFLAPPKTTVGAIDKLFVARDVSPANTN